MAKAAIGNTVLSIVNVGLNVNINTRNYLRTFFCFIRPLFMIFRLST